MKSKNTLRKEQTGKIIRLQNNLGTILSNHNNFNFDIQSHLNKLNLNDDVIFLVEKNNTATAIRKLYTNPHGIKFSARVDASHIHIDLDIFLPVLINNISDSIENYIEIEYEFPDVIGKSECVHTNNSDTIMYGKRKGRKGYSRFVLNRQPEDCKSVFAIFKKNENGYLIITIFVGKKAAREPWDSNATSSDKVFWENHALILNMETIQAGSLTTTPNDD